MLTVMFILLAVLSAGFIFVVIMAVTAPVGYQDESGFHFGCKQTESPEESGYEMPELHVHRWEHRPKRIVRPLRDENMARFPA